MENSHFTWLGNIHHSLLPPTLPEQQEYNCCFWLGSLPVADSSNSQILFLSLLVSTFTSSRAVCLSVSSIRRGKLLENMLFEVRYYCYQISNYQTWITEEFIGKIWIIFPVCSILVTTLKKLFLIIASYLTLDYPFNRCSLLILPVSTLVLVLHETCIKLFPVSQGNCQRPTIPSSWWPNLI